MLTIFDYGASTPAVGSGSLSRAVPATPTTITLAEFGLGVGSFSNKVQLNATVGIAATLANPSFLFSIIRDTGVIFTTLAQAALNVSEDQTIAFEAVDIDVPPGYHDYLLLVTNVNPLPLVNQGNVIGPITFTGLSLQ